MPIKTVTMTHPKTKATIQAPESGVEIHKKSGWVVASKKDADAAQAAATGDAPGPVDPVDGSKPLAATKK